MARERIISAENQSPEEAQVNHALRPERFGEYVGQPQLIRKLQIAVDAARTRREPVEHILLHGPPGLGKTTLAHVISNEIGARIHVTSGPALTKGADMGGLLTGIGAGDVMFIDEIHRLPAAVEEFLYPVMEDFKMDFTMDSGLHARSRTVPLPKFTLIGATTRIGLLTSPMRSRFGISGSLDFYDLPSLKTILSASARKLGMDAPEDALAELAGRCRGTPRIANRLLRRVRDFATVEAKGKVTVASTRATLELEGIDAKGLDEQDRAFLRTLIDVYSGGPAGIEAIAATMLQELDTLVDVVEPYLLQIGYVIRTRQGRRATKSAYDHLGLPYTPPKDTPDLFSDSDGQERPGSA